MAGRKIGEIYGEIKLKNSQFISGLDQSKSKLQGFKTSSIAIFAGVAAASYGLVKGIGAIATAASDLEEQTAKFGTVFRGSMEVADKAVDDLTESFAMSTREARQHMAAIQDLLVPMGIARDKASEFSGEIVKLAADLGSFNNLPTEQVMRDIESALTGQYRTMRKYGVVLFDTDVRQRALNDGLAATNDELTAGDRALTAYKMMVEGSQDALGDMERTSESFANTQKRFNAAMEDFKGVLGDYILPGLTFWVDKLTKLIDLTTDMISLTDEQYKLGTIEYEKAYIAELDKKIQTYKDLMYPLDEINALEDERIWRLQKLNKLLRAGRGLQKQQREEIKETSNAVKSLAKSWEDEYAAATVSASIGLQGIAVAEEVVIEGGLNLQDQMKNMGIQAVMSLDAMTESASDFTAELIKMITKALIMKGIMIAFGLSEGGYVSAQTMIGAQKGGYVPAALMSPNLPKISEGYTNRPSILVGEGRGGELVIPEDKLKGMVQVEVRNVIPLKDAFIDAYINLPEGKKQLIYRKSIKPAMDRENLK